MVYGTRLLLTFYWDYLLLINGHIDGENDWIVAPEVPSDLIGLVGFSLIHVEKQSTSESQCALETIDRT